MASWRSVPTTLLAVLVVTPLALFAWQSVTDDKSPDQVRLSVDGVRWTEEIEDSLFYSETPLEPGEARTAILLVRNDAPVRAQVTLTVSRSAGPASVEGSALAITATVGDGRPQRLDADKRSDHVRLKLDSGESATVLLRAELASAAPGAQEVDGTGIRYRVVGSGRPLEDRPSSLLAATDARLVLAPVFLGLALIVSAVVMTRRSAREEAAQSAERGGS